MPTNKHTDPVPFIKVKGLIVRLDVGGNMFKANRIALKMHMR
jgi:hypothetical protein